ncbi:MAG: DEAD/DEAH box helicase family protein, partial [Treponema sp.]|uniref:DEAD/DEAH box helicase family protein n=1 Tax=Treponema sp. TaxID=166 RepID=UPI00298EC890
MSDINYTEKNFENYIVNILTTKSGYIHGSNSDYNPQKSIISSTFISFVKNTQPDSWTALCDKFDTEQEAEEKLIDELVLSRNALGTLDLLRKGFTLRSIQFDTVYWKPENDLNPDTVKLYKQNTLTVINQLIGDAGKSVHVPIPDIVLFVNGIPVVTAELKFELQGQDYLEAEYQYKSRSLAEPLFKFKTGPLVHFTVDTTNASMTTKLAKFGTNFLPFNLGSNGAGNQGGKGNPKTADGHFATDYIWENVLNKDSLLDIIQSFITIEVDSKTKEETLIFPRYHQLDVVRKLLKDVEVTGSAKNFLIEHSAGSGKSNTIAWLAFHLNNLYFANKPEKVFDTVIILNDRRVLDKQTRNTIMSFNPKEGTVKIATKSSQITDFIKLGNVIIISTIQKFPMIYRELEEIKANNPNRRFAVIADEAHQSQTGTAAGKVKLGLGADSQIKAEDQDDTPEEGDASDEEQDKILRQVATGKQSNMSFFAFTATPTGETLQMFGVPCKVKDPKTGKDK